MGFVSGESRPQSEAVAQLTVISGCGADANALRVTTLALVHSTAEYSAPVWCCINHTLLIDSNTNDALRIITGCLRLRPTDNLPALDGIQPAELHRERVTLTLIHSALEPRHLLDPKLTRSSIGTQRRLKSRHSFVPDLQLQSSKWGTQSYETSEKTKS